MSKLQAPGQPVPHSDPRLVALAEASISTATADPVTTEIEPNLNVNDRHEVIHVAMRGHVYRYVSNEAANKVVEATLKLVDPQVVEQWKLRSATKSSDTVNVPLFDIDEPPRGGMGGLEVVESPSGTPSSLLLVSISTRKEGSQYIIGQERTEYNFDGEMIGEPYFVPDSQ